VLGVLGSLLLEAEFLKSPSAGIYLYVGLIEEAVKLAALWLLVAVAAAAAWRSSRPRRACACADRRRRFLTAEPSA
jgi:hypothetical protein